MITFNDHPKKVVALIRTRIKKSIDSGNFSLFTTYMSQLKQLAAEGVLEAFNQYVSYYQLVNPATKQILGSNHRYYQEIFSLQVKAYQFDRFRKNLQCDQPVI